jgi:hypothetical protein
MRKGLIVKTLLLTTAFLVVFYLPEDSVLADSPKLVHVEGTYIPANPLPSTSPSLITSTNTPSPTRSPTTTLNPTTTPSDNAEASGTPSETLTPTTSPTTSSSTNQPTAAPTPTAAGDLQSPTPENQPKIPEITLIAVIFTLTLLTILAIVGRKSRTNLKSLASVAVLIGAVMFPLSANFAYGEQSTPALSTSPNVAFSLWFTNGTTFPTEGTNCNGYTNGGPYLNIGGIKPIASGFGSSADKTSSIVVIRNDGNTPANISLKLLNVVVPSNIEISMHYFSIDNQTFQPYTNQWMGNSNVGQNPLATSQYMWLAITVTLAQPDVHLSGTPNYSFSYSFDIEITATQA